MSTLHFLEHECYFGCVCSFRVFLFPVCRCRISLGEIQCTEDTVTMSPLLMFFPEADDLLVDRESGTVAFAGDEMSATYG
jgi:hypothetical protein